MRWDNGHDATSDQATIHRARAFVGKKPQKDRRDCAKPRRYVAADVIEAHFDAEALVKNPPYPYGDDLHSWIYRRAYRSA